MSSVIWPVDHNKVWSKNLSFIVAFVSLSPFLIIWNTIISPKIIIYYFGGFFMLGLKAVEWADISLFLFLVRSVAVIITVASTVIMFLRMSKMKKRMKSSERTLCLACVIHSICFMVPSFFEVRETFQILEIQHFLKLLDFWYWYLYWISGSRKFQRSIRQFLGQFSHSTICMGCSQCWVRTHDIIRNQEINFQISVDNDIRQRSTTPPCIGDLNWML